MTEIKQDEKRECSLLVQPGNPAYEGEELEALGWAMRRRFRRINVVLDDTACGNTPEESVQMAREWLDRNRERLEDCGISLEAGLTRWSEFAFCDRVQTDLERLYKNDRKMRQVMHSLALGELEPGSADPASLRGVLPKIFRRVAGLIYMKALSDSPVAWIEGMPPHNYILENARSGALPPGALVLPEFIEIDTARPAAKPVPAVAATSSAEVIQLFPK